MIAKSRHFDDMTRPRDVDLRWASARATSWCRDEWRAVCMDGFSMTERELGAPLGRFWRLADGTECVVSRVDAAWVLWLKRDAALLRYEEFDRSDAVVVAARRWRSDEELAS